MSIEFDELFSKVEQYFKESPKSFRYPYNLIFKKQELRNLLSYINEDEEQVYNFETQENKLKAFIIGIWKGKKNIKDDLCSFLFFNQSISERDKQNIQKILIEKYAEILGLNLKTVDKIAKQIRKQY